MNESDSKMLDWIEFVTNKFDSNHRPWKYSRDLGDFQHIRYERDYTGYEHWTKRLQRFFEEVTVGHWNPKGFMHQLSGDRSFWVKLKEWPMDILVTWKVYVLLDSNRPDGQVNGNLTHWEEDGEYIAMFCPYVGREVLKFLRAEPDNPFAQEILRAMRESKEVSWPSKEESSS